jgi:hypothetical protein
VLINTTVQEKNITYPTDAKLAIKIINRLNKLAKHHNIQQRRIYVKEVKNCRLAIRHFRHVKKRTVWIAIEVLVIRVALKLQHNTLVSLKNHTTN